MAIYAARPLIQNAAQVVAEKKRQAETLNAMLPISTHSKLSGHIKACWDDAYQAKLDIQKRMLSCARRRKGEYEPDVLAAIREETEGSEVFIPATNLKCTALHDYIMDVYNADEKPWNISPTPIPDLPMDLQMQAIMRVKEEIMSAIEPLSEEQILQLDENAKKEISQALNDTAKERAERMTAVINDAMLEGQWMKVLNDVVEDVATYPAGIMKGPILRMVDSLEFVQQEDGSWSIEVKPSLTKQFERVSPLDFYPQRNIKDINEGYCIERLRLNRRALTGMKGIKGYSDTEIDTVLQECTRGTMKTTWMFPSADVEADEAENRKDTAQSSPEDRIDGLEFWGSIPGEWLIEWGMSKTKIDDPQKEYQVAAILIGTHVIRAALNCQPLGKKPYHMASFKDVQGSVWGKGLPELVSGIQDILNATVRALVNNVAIASGPQCAVDTALMPIGDDYKHLRPWQVHELSSADTMTPSMPAKLPIEFFQPTMQSEALIRVVEYFTKMMDEYTGIPAYTHGIAGSGAGDTSSGLAMLMTAAGKIIKNVITKIDRNIVESTVSRLFEHEMRYNPDNSIKGDARVIVKGSGALIAKEQKLIRLSETLDRSRNEIVMQVIGLQGFAELLRKTWRALDIDIDDLIPSLEELKQRDAILQASIQQKNMPNTANLQPPDAQTLDVAGQPVVGQDSRAFSQGQGAE